MSFVASALRFHAHHKNGQGEPKIYWSATGCNFGNSPLSHDISQPQVIDVDWTACGFWWSWPRFSAYLGGNDEEKFNPLPASFFVTSLGKSQNLMASAFRTFATPLEVIEKNKSYELQGEKELTYVGVDQPGWWQFPTACCVLQLGWYIYRECLGRYSNRSHPRILTQASMVRRKPAFDKPSQTRSSLWASPFNK